MLTARKRRRVGLLTNCETVGPPVSSIRELHQEGRNYRIVNGRGAGR
jgi:hypothetical protein